MSRVILQLLSHSCPREIKEEFLRAGNTIALFAVEDNASDSSSLPASLDGTDCELGRVTLVDEYGLM